MPEPNIVGFSRNYWGGRPNGGPQRPTGRRPQRPSNGGEAPGPNYSQVVRELEEAIRVLNQKGNAAEQANRNLFKSRLTAYQQIPMLKRFGMSPKGLGNYANNGYPKKKGVGSFISQIVGSKVEGVLPFQTQRLNEAIRNANRRGQTNLAAALRAKKAAAEQAALNKKAAAEHAARNKKTAAEEKEAAKEAARRARKASEEQKATEKKALRTAIQNAMIVLNSKGSNATTNNRAAYIRAIQAYKQAGYNVSLSNRNLGVNRYSTTTGASRTTKTTTTTRSAANHYEFIKNMREKLRKNPSQQRRLLDDALTNLSRRLYSISNNKRALEMIDNYRRLSSNSSYTANLNRRAERRKAAKKNENRNKNKKGGWSGGGQQIIFGQPPAGAGHAGAAGPVFMPGHAGAAAPMIIPGPAGAAPVIVPGGGGGAGPSISVAPTIRVNVPQPAAQAAAQMLPPAERSALNNVGGYRRAASLVQNAGGPESVSRALNALQRSNGNVPKAMANSGLPRNVFANVNKLGGPVTARRTLTAVKKVSRKFEGPVKARRAISRSLAIPVTNRDVSTLRRTKPAKKRSKKKYVSSACACGKTSQANKLRTVVSQLRRKNLEKNFLKCLLP